MMPLQIWLIHPGLQLVLRAMPGVRYVVIVEPTCRGNRPYLLRYWILIVILVCRQ